MNGEAWFESLQRIVIEPFGEGRVEEARIVPVVIGVLHRHDPRVREDAEQHFVDLLELSV